ATGHTAVYTPPTVAAQPGTWAAGPDFPTIDGKTIGAKDAPACLLPNGRVLLVGGPVDGQAASYLAPTYFFEFDGTHLPRVPDPPNSTGVPYQGRMLLLPTGQVLFAAETPDVYCYTPDGAPADAWRPGIVSVPAYLVPGGGYTLQGRQLNGLSQAAAYGDDATMATNYPLVRVRHVDTGGVYYCRTSGHSTMGVATGSAPHTTNFRVPPGLPPGAIEITAVANGIPSAPVPATCIVPVHPSDPVAAWAWLTGSLADGPLWAWGPNGPVPVGPWGPKVVKDAAAARRAMRSAMDKLEAIGARAVRMREQAAAAVPPAVDLEAKEKLPPKKGTPAGRKKGRPA
ncbi:MAG: hypothetical protein J2P46_06045, partial [Zavarzinella sp.]|nr:hypothetical protein [Zavarzinella sp.]